MHNAPRSYNGPYQHEYLNQVAFPMGGMGAGMICLEGTGAFSHVSLRHKPEVFNEPLMFAALHVQGAPTARVLEGLVPMRKAFGAPDTGNGSGSYGLPRFAKASFTTRFPFGLVRLTDPAMPVTVTLTGWSPFVPLDADASSLPVAAVEYTIKNCTARPLKSVFSFHAKNFMAISGVEGQAVKPIRGGFVLSQDHSHHSPFVASWQISTLQQKRRSVAQAPAVKLTDTLGWSPIRADNRGFVNIHERTHAADGIVYIATRVHVAKAGAWVLRLGHDGGVNLFVDGRSVAVQPECKNPARPDRTLATAQLSRGDHELVVALDTCSGNGWGIFLSFGLTTKTSVSSNPEYPMPEAWVGADYADEAYFAAFTPEAATLVDCGWFRGGWFDPLTQVWDTIAAGQVISRRPHSDEPAGPGASLYVPFMLTARAEKTVRLLMAWYVPGSSLACGTTSADTACASDGAACACHAKTRQQADTYVPWYAKRFGSIHKVVRYWQTAYDELRERSRRFSDCFYDTTLPPEVVEAIAANLTILKSPTSLRDTDGRFWGWEGCCDNTGCCHGTCTHVWNYAQALCHLFPALERTLRETEFLVNQDARGHQTFRSSLPIRPPDHTFHAAADGQLGGIMKMYREWRISGNTAWMSRLWPRIRQSLDYCIATWDPGHTGTLVEPHHNTYDIEFWGADGMCTSFYLGALSAAIHMGRTCSDDVSRYTELMQKGKKAMESALWNGAYFIQKIQWTGLKAADPTRTASAANPMSPETLSLLKREGPKYQYGSGCLSDGVLGDWIARVCGVAPVLNAGKVERHLRSVFRYNYHASLANHANPQRSTYAFGQEGGLLLCSWPRGGALSLPFPYSKEVWTGIEYQVASHFIMMGWIKAGLRIVQTARDRYDGRYRNPFNEYECGHWYARAMSSYGLLQALSGARYDAVDKTLHLQPAIKGDFKAFLSTATGFGTVGVRNGKPFLKVVSGKIDVKKIAS